MNGLNDGHQHGADGVCEDADEHHQHGAGRRRREPDDRLQRIEVITGRERRHRWSREEKARITAESFEPGANVAAIARANRVSIGLLHYWRRCAREAAEDGPVRFLPLVAEAAASESDGVQAGSIEVELCGARIRVSGSVDRGTLEMVLAAVRASA